jgi:hypothetical protein
VCACVPVCVCVYEQPQNPKPKLEAPPWFHARAHGFTRTRAVAHAQAATRTRAFIGPRETESMGRRPHTKLTALGWRSLAPSVADALLALQNDSETISGGESSPGLVTYAYLLEAECELLHRTMNPFEVL